jgi:pimeloyl-ACP methyl ester carboxylesterase
VADDYDGERLSREIPNARLVRVEDASHWIPHDTPRRFAEEVGNFLARNHATRD